jgi:hypothetical protein
MVRKPRAVLASILAGTAGIMACTVLAAWSKRRDSRLAMGNRAATTKSATRLPVEGRV